MTHIKKPLAWRRLVFGLLPIICLTGMLQAASAPAGAQEPPAGAQRMIESLELREANVLDAVRVISELTGVNIFATRESGEREVSLFLREATVHDAIDGLARVSGLWYRYNKKTKAYLLMTAEEYQDDIVIFREDFTRIFTLRHQNVVTTGLIIEALFGDRVELTTDTEDDDDVLDQFGSGSFGGAGGGSRAASSNRTSNRRFSRDNRRSFSSGRSGRTTGSAGDEGEEIQILEGENLSPEQLSTLRQDLGEDGLPRVSATDLAAVVRREPPIFITVNRLHNLLYVRTSDEVALSEIARIVRESDRPTPNVMLEMKILELTVGDSFRSIFDFAFSSSGTTAVTDDQGNTTLTPTQALELGNFPLQGGTFFYQFINDNILAAIEVLETEDRVNVLGTPVLLASNSRPAQIFIGEERVIETGIEQTAVTSVQGTVTNFIEVETEIRDIGTTLRIIPRINSDRTVTLLIEQDNSTVNEEGASLSASTNNGNLVSVPIDTVDTANITGTVVAKDGLTVAIGGLIRNTDSDLRDKVPLLGDIPVLGTLFRRDRTEKIQTEIVLLITPHVLTTPEEAEQVSKRRIADSSINPELESFGFAGSRQPSDRKSVASVRDFLALTRFAAQAMSGDDPVVLRGVVPLPVEQGVIVSLMPSSAIDIMPERSWRRGDLFVTAVRIRNRSTSAQALEPREILGRWLAATFENERLAPAGESGDEAIGYLLSEAPFLESVFTSHRPVPPAGLGDS